MVPSVSQANEVIQKYSAINMFSPMMHSIVFGDPKLPLSSKAAFAFAIAIQPTTHRTVSQYEESPQVLGFD